jgi:hypothetical protein
MDEASTSSRGAETLQHRRRKTTKVNDEIDRKILKSLEKIEPDEDEAFFISVLPSVRQFSADDKLDFRIIVLKAIKDIKTRSGCQFSIFDANTFSKQFTRLRQIVSLSLQCVGFKLRQHFVFTSDNRHSRSSANIF